MRVRPGGNTMKRKILLISPIVLMIAAIFVYSFITAHAIRSEIQSYQLSSRHSVARKVIGKIAVSLENFRKEIGRYPKTEEGLAVLCNPANLEPSLKAKWKGPYYVARNVRPRALYSLNGEKIYSLAYDTAVGTFVLRYYGSKDDYLLVARFSKPPSVTLDRPVYYHGAEGYINKIQFDKLKKSF
jgi:hypothetical protein